MRSVINNGRRPSFATSTRRLAAVAVGGVCLSMTVACKHRVAETKSSATPLIIIASCDTAGWIEPCGCSSGQSGGLSRRATLAHELSEGHPATLVSVGGAASGSRAYDLEKLRSILMGESLMGYAAHNLGWSELAIPAESLRRVAGGVPLLSTNVKNDSPAFNVVHPFIVSQQGDYRILVLGVVGGGDPERGYRIEDPETAILNVLSKVDEQEITYDAVVVLAYLERESLMELASRLPEVDVFIGGPGAQSIAPTQVGSTLVTGVNNKGKFLARVTGNREGSNQIFTADLHEVTDRWAQDDVQQQNLVAFRDRLRDLDLAADQTSFVAVTHVSSSDDRFVGIDACRSCHNHDDDAWRMSAHSHAWQTLEQKTAEVDAACQRCHTTGFGKSGGFNRRSDSTDRVDVGCESCHGPSSRHVDDPSVSTPWQADETCISCHDHENSPSFQYDSYWSKIVHGEKEPVDETL
ncbi:MAG: hypothetical protein KDB00_29770 [Planctomycetales bacterium]|nr:hypothetical protein [Planctomycetales bacterium]